MKNIRDELRALGWWNGLLYIAARALQRVTFNRSRIVKYYFVAQPVPSSMLAPTHSTSSIRTRRAEREDPLVAAFPRPEHVIRQRFADGAICFVAVKDGALAGFIWIRHERYNEDEVRCLYVLEPRGAAAWDFDVWVAPEFRLTRTFAKLWDAANAFLREQGYCWSVSRISAFNPASLASHRRLGIVHLQSGLFWVFGPAQVAFFSCPPYVHFSGRHGRTPVLRLHIPEMPHSRSKTATTPAGPFL